MPDNAETRRDELPLQLRFAPINSVDKEARTVTVVWTTGARVPRYDWRMDRRYIEELSLDPGHIRMERLASGRAPFLAVHAAWDLRAVLGIVERAWIEKGEHLAQVRFSRREDVEPVFRDVQDGILPNVSVGYRVHRFEMIPPATADGDWIYRAVDWEPFEISLVGMPADKGAGVRGEADKGEGRPSYPCEFITPAAAAGSSSTTRNQETTMTEKVNTPVPAADPNAGTQQVEEQVRKEAAAAERTRIDEIRSRALAMGLGEDFARELINSGDAVEVACRKIVDAAAARKPAPEVNGRRSEIEVTEDGRDKLRSAVSAALVHRVNPRGELPNNGAGDFRYMSLSRIAEEVLRSEGVRVRGLSQTEICTRALHSTSDFANILADASNKRLRQSYMENVPSYTRWARRAPNAPDFKTINVVQLSGAPDLQKVLEGGEFKRGKILDAKETYQVFTYGRIIGISRQAIVNDDLSAFDRTPRALAAAARRLENSTVYALLTANGTMADGGALFNATAVTTAGGHANLGTGTGSALGTGSLTTMRTAMRKQVGLNSEPLNVAPAFLIGPAALEQTMYQLTSSQFVPATTSAINEFRAGGKTALEPIVEALLDASSATAWFAAANPGEIDTIEYCYLDGSEGLYLESQVGFNVDGVEFKARLDFAAAAIDHRGLYKANGA